MSVPSTDILLADLRRHGVKDLPAPPAEIYLAAEALCSAGYATQVEIPFLQGRSLDTLPPGNWKHLFLFSDTHQVRENIPLVASLRAAYPKMYITVVADTNEQTAGEAFDAGADFFLYATVPVAAVRLLKELNTPLNPFLDKVPALMFRNILKKTTRNPLSDETVTLSMRDFIPALKPWLDRQYAAKGYAWLEFPQAETGIERVSLLAWFREALLVRENTYMIYAPILPADLSSWWIAWHHQRSLVQGDIMEWWNADEPAPKMPEASLWGIHTDVSKVDSAQLMMLTALDPADWSISEGERGIIPGPFFPAVKAGNVSPRSRNKAALLVSAWMYRRYIRKYAFHPAELYWWLRMVMLRIVT